MGKTKPSESAWQAPPPASVEARREALYLVLAQVPAGKVVSYGELAQAAAAVTLPFFRSDIGHEDKGGAKGFDPVTEADVQRLMAETKPAEEVACACS